MYYYVIHIFQYQFKNEVFTLPIMNKCPSLESGQAGKAESCKGCPNASKCASAKPDQDISIIAENISKIKLIVAVLSGKGGVGKSTISCNIAKNLAAKNINTLILDFDLSGPSIPRLTNTTESYILEENGVLKPLHIEENLYAVSVGYLEGFSEKTTVFNTVSKNFTIKNILKRTDFSGIDVMIIDTPPNITEEHLALSNYMPLLKGIVVSTPQKLALDDVRRQLTFCKKVRIDMLGLVENMKYFICGECMHVNKIFSDSGVYELCQSEGIEYFGSLELKKSIAQDSDFGRKIQSSSLEKISDKIISLIP